MFVTPYWFAQWRNIWQIRTGIKTLVPPLVEPISLAEAALHLRLDAIDSPASYADEELVRWQISAAREICERYMDRSLAIQTLEYRANAFSVCAMNAPIELKRGPVRRLIQVSYIDEAGTEIILDDGTGSPTNPQFEIDRFNEPELLIPPYNMTWPSARTHAGSVRILYEAGYSLPNDSPTEYEMLPYTLKCAMLLMLGHLYENREDTARGEGGATLLNEIPMGSKFLMDPYKLRLGFA